MKLGPSHYCNESYDTKERFISYWHQISEIIKLRPKRILEIGVGNGFVYRYLKEKKLDIMTLDIEERLSPNVRGNILNIPFLDESFNVVACYEVLEHLPYEKFCGALSEIFRVSNQYATLSLPDVGRVYRCDIQIPKLGGIKRLISLPRFKKTVEKFESQHYWEIGKIGYPLSEIIADIENVGFDIDQTYRVFEHPYHRFFVLKKGIR